MPRNARKDISSKFIHLMIQGINKEYIFNDDFEIKTYLKYLNENIKETDLKIVSYCIMNNHAHFLIYVTDIYKISKLMSKVNTKYAMFYNQKNNRCGVLFRNRYKAEEIINWSHLFCCIKYIHNNPVKAGMCENAGDYKYSSYNEYKNKQGILLDWNFIQKFIKKADISLPDILDGYENDNHLYFLEYDDIDEQELLKSKILEEFMKENNIENIDDIKDNIKYLKKIIRIMCVDYRFNKSEIANLLKLNRTKIYRILNEL